MAIKKIKISSLPLAESLVGLFTIGVDSLNRSVKVSLQFLKTAADNANNAATSATQAASSANTAATSANNAASAATTAKNEANTATTAANSAATSATQAANNANTAATSANNAATNANTKATLAENKAADANTAADNANQKAEAAQEAINAMQELAASLSPTGIILDYPKTVTYRNTGVMQIDYTMLPENARRNVLFLGDNNAVTVLPDGGFTVNKPGTSRIFVIPTENTNIYKTIEITVIEPGLRKIKTNALRFTGNGSLRLT
ncbi:MAG: hypothetical protein LBO74_08485 [Candidatus Symbiothrix sp.]|jgi:hypothetical protein|nr:hypothetical protein [Candidatus Symbiothrix sp.]